MKIKSIKKWRHAMFVISLILTFLTVSTLSTIFLPLFFVFPTIVCWMIYKFLYDISDLMNYRIGRIFIKDGKNAPSSTKYYVMIKEGNESSPLTKGNILVLESEMNSKLSSFLEIQKKDTGVPPIYVTSEDLSICVNAKMFAKKSLKLEEK